MNDYCCPLCGGTEVSQVFALRDVPVVCNQLWPDAAAARAAPTGDVDLVLCEDCLLISNRAFDPKRIVYAPGYENALHFSPSFQAFAEDLVRRLVDTYGLRGRAVIEIGCGDGHILHLMAENGVGRATGFDPSMAGRPTPHAERAEVEIVPEYFRSDQLDRPFDAIICRHVLEHLDAPVGLLSDIRAAIGDRDVPVYFEVPNAQWMLESISMWDVIYEHVTYWTPPTLKALFLRCGFAPVRIETVYGGQFLMLEARPAPAQPDYRPPSEDSEPIRRAARSFGRAAEAELAGWRDRLAGLGAGRAVVWGAGSKGITFVNAIGAAGAGLAALVDLNTRKHGLVAPGIGIPVIAPEELRNIAPALVLISNALYEAEIRERVGELGLASGFGLIAG